MFSLTDLVKKIDEITTSYHMPDLKAKQLMGLYDACDNEEKQAFLIAIVGKVICVSEISKMRGER